MRTIQTTFLIDTAEGAIIDLVTPDILAHLGVIASRTKIVSYLVFPSFASCHTLSLFCRLAECTDGDAIDEAVDRCPDEVQGAKKPKGASDLLQAPLGEAAEFRQPRLH